MIFISCSIVCDSWLMLEFPVLDNGQSLLFKAVKLRNKWDLLLNHQLQGTRHILNYYIILRHFSNIYNNIY